jgi:hypothetical protein
VVGVDEAVLDDAVAALTVVECFEFDSVFAGVVFGGVLGGAGSTVSPEAGSLDFGSVSTPLVCAPPLLLTVTPEPTSVLDDVVPDVFGVPVGVVPVSVGVAPLLVVEVVVPVDGVAVDPVDSPVEVVDAELVDDSEDVPVVSAAATPYPVATAATSHAATAMPPYPPSLAAL